MTIKEEFINYVDTPKRSVKNVFSGFRNIDTLGDVSVGEEFTIPNHYVVMDRPVIINGTPIRDRDNHQIFTQYIECKNSLGHTIEFYPASLVQIAFTVDPKTGKDVFDNRIRRAEGPLVDYVKQESAKGKNMNQIMEQLKGCTVKLLKLDFVCVRAFGVPNDKATQADVETRKIGTWTLVGEKRPEGWAF